MACSWKHFCICNVHNKCMLINTAGQISLSIACNTLSGNCVSHQVLLLGENDLNLISVISPLFQALDLSLSIYVRNYKWPD